MPHFRKLPAKVLGTHRIIVVATGEEDVDMPIGWSLAEAVDPLKTRSRPPASAPAARA